MISENLDRSDLYVDAIYGGSRKGHGGDDPLPALLGVDSRAGFRVLGRRPYVSTLKLIVLKTNFRNAEWPDSLDRETGVFTYYGDRRAPGDLHRTPRDGNLILRNLFDAAHAVSAPAHFPPIFVFGSTGDYRDVQFFGLAVPGAEGLTGDEDLVAVWRIQSGARFQNYKAIFSILDVPKIGRAWIDDIQRGCAVVSPHAPTVWLDWVHGRKITPLRAERVSRVRTKEEQRPRGTSAEEYLAAVYTRFRARPHAFEYCAMELFKMFAPNVVTSDLTRPWRDGGRDALGKYRIGAQSTSVDVEFALEAKCYECSRGVGVREMSRLISRLRFRQFGVLVTTSYVSRQAYEEIVEDGHPVIVVSGGDIADLLRKRFGSVASLKNWLEKF